MIKNSRQYRLAKAQLARFRGAYSNASVADLSNHLDAKELRELELAALQSQIDSIQAQLKEYDDLVSGSKTVLEVNSFDVLPRVLIQARIASGLSQKDLAKRLSLPEQQIQRYEATEYESASLSRINEVVRALGLKTQKEFALPSPISFARLWRNLAQLGIHRDWVLRRMLPRETHGQVEYAEKDRSSDCSGLILKVSSVLGNIFGFTPAALIAGDVSALPTLPTQIARFKLPAKVRAEAVSAYTVYVHYLALVVIGATSGKNRHPIPEDWNDVRATILQHYGKITFSNALQYAWDMGIPVLPLDDAGTFHGACWRIDGRNIIVIKQGTRTESRWLIDLLHELFHAFDHLDQRDFAVLEDDEMSESRRESEDERAATEFASDVVLDGRASELAQLCAHMAQGQIPQLKSVVKHVAKQEQVPVGVLANYLAYRLSLDGKNWWGTAHNLQEEGEDPWSMARDVLLTKLHFSRINPLDRELLSRALACEEVQT